MTDVELRALEIMAGSRLKASEMEQLKQLWEPVWDGDLISKFDRTVLWKAGLVLKFNGYNMRIK